jgi:hypothetical protein
MRSLLKKFQIFFKNNSIMVKVISVKRGIALTGIVLFLSLNACRTCNCPAYSEEKSPPTPPKVEKPPPSPPIRESYYAVTETGNEWWMPENTFHN